MNYINGKDGFSLEVDRQPEPEDAKTYKKRVGKGKALEEDNIKRRPSIPLFFTREIKVTQ